MYNEHPAVPLNSHTNMVYNMLLEAMVLSNIYHSPRNVFFIFKTYLTSIVVYYVINATYPIIPPLTWAGTLLQVPHIVF